MIKSIKLYTSFHQKIRVCLGNFNQSSFHWENKTAIYGQVIVLGVLEAVEERNSSRTGLIEDKKLISDLGENHHEIVVQDLYKGVDGNSKYTSEIQEAEFSTCRD